MITFKNGGKLLEPGDDLSVLLGGVGAKHLFMDAETTSFTFDRYGNRPYAGDRACGWSISWDDHPHSYYLPIRHTSAGGVNHNVDLEQSLRIIKQLVTTCDAWVNHNVGPFDAHFAAEDGAEIRLETKLIDTLQLAKLIDSDRLTKGGYGLDVLSRDWLDEVITDQEARLNAYLDTIKRGNKKCRDYAMVPVDIAGEYACQDVLTNRKLYARMLKAKDEIISDIWDVEQMLTPVMYDVTRTGLIVNVEELQVLEYQIMTELTFMEEEIHKLTGMSCTPSNSNHCYELLVNRYGLPVLSWTDSDPPGPSFDAEALMKYLSHPDVVKNPLLTQVLQIIRAYRDRSTLLTFFVRPYQREQVNGVLHSSYNQIVRTGRQSSKEPNSQQLSSDAKKLVHPASGCSLLSADYSQIEFRLLIHFTKEPNAIEAYQKNPDQDFHQWVADMCGIDRSPAKNVNFAIGYGGGKEKVTMMLASDMRLVGDMGKIADEEVEKGNIKPEQRKPYFDFLCRRRAEEVYNEYHAAIPGLKVETNVCGRTARARGWVKTLGGRKRHMPVKAAWKSFNSVCQGSAADIMKERTIAVAPRYNKQVRDLMGMGAICAQVHDSNLFHGPTEVMNDPEVVSMLAYELEHTRYDKVLRVPMRVAMGRSDKSWSDADDKANKVTIQRRELVTT